MTLQDLHPQEKDLEQGSQTWCSLAQYQRIFLNKIKIKIKWKMVFTMGCTSSNWFIIPER
jgi:hypothetical protein